MRVAYRDGKNHVFEEVTAIVFQSNGMMKGVDVILIRRDNSAITVMAGISEGTANKIKNAYLYGVTVTVQIDRFQ